ncbi:MAG TPA: lipocalin family protein [Fimbriiglobus sp.]|nr:lipocalin family protein [Fimbriiglobus sp.]
MSRFTTSLAALVALTVSVSALAQVPEPKDSEKKLVGKWQLVKSSKGDLPAGLVATIQFETGNKLKVHIERADKKRDVSGTWKLEGKLLTFEYDGPSKGEKDTRTIKKLTDDDLVTVSEKDVTEEFKKVKEPKKK